jgi:vacuolar-type H+-ATPase subunit E/Vma4
MGLEEVKAAVRRASGAREARVIAEAEAEAKRIIATANEKITVNEHEFDAETRRIVERIRRREQASASIQAKTIVLTAKREAIERAVEATRERVNSLRASERHKVIAALCARAERELGVVDRVYCRSEDVPIVATVLPRTESIADDSTSTGIIAVDPTNTVLVDLTLDTLLEIVRERETTTLARILFETDATNREETKDAQEESRNESEKKTEARRNEKQRENERHREKKEKRVGIAATLDWKKVNE